MPVHLDQLQAFVSAAEEGSFSAAARKLGKAQSSVSALVQNLEIDLGLTLFDRSSRNPVLTGQGQAIIREAKAVLQGAELVEIKSRGLNAGVESVVTISVDEAMYPMARLLPVLGQFRERFPSTQLVLLVGPHTAPGRLVRDHLADLAIMRSTEDYPEDFHLRGIGTAEFLTLCGPDHPLSRLEWVTEEDLLEHCHVRITTAVDGARPEDSEISQHRIYLDSFGAMIELVKNGLGWAQVPSHLAEGALASGELVSLKSLYQSVPYTCAVDLVWHRSRQLGSAGRWLRDTLSGV